MAEEIENLEVLKLDMDGKGDGSIHGDPSVCSLEHRRETAGR